MKRSVCEYETSLVRCQKKIRARKTHKYCREHYKLVNNKPRPLNRIKKEKTFKTKPEIIVKAKRKK